MTLYNLTDPVLEITDPTPNINELFVLFSDMFFEGALGPCTVEWSKRLTSCAGVCSFDRVSGLASIRLSEPLLKLRPRSNLIETLLHEMIHGYLFLTSRIVDREGHGPEFQYHMNRINRMSNTNITIYHTFHAEVASYKLHVWRCDGPCQSRPPYYGYVKRAMNRAPSKNDNWWVAHLMNCSGKFVKISEPEKSEKQKKQITEKAGGVTKRKALTDGTNKKASSKGVMKSKMAAPRSKENNTPDGTKQLSMDQWLKKT